MDVEVASASRCDRALAATRSKARTLEAARRGAALWTTSARGPEGVGEPSMARSNVPNALGVIVASYVSARGAAGVSDVSAAGENSNSVVASRSISRTTATSFGTRRAFNPGVLKCTTDAGGGDVSIIRSPSLFVVVATAAVVTASEAFLERLFGLLGVAFPANLSFFLCASTRAANASYLSSADDPCALT